MATAWRWLGVVTLGVVAWYLVWYFIAPSQISDSNPPICATAAGRTVSCESGGWSDVAAVATGLVVAATTAFLTRPRRRREP